MRLTYCTQERVGSESLVHRAPLILALTAALRRLYSETGALWLLHEYTPIGKLCSVNRWNPRKNRAGQVFLTTRLRLNSPSSSLLFPIAGMTVPDLTSVYNMCWLEERKGARECNYWDMNAQYTSKLSFILFLQQNNTSCFPPLINHSDFRSGSTHEKLIVFMLLTLSWYVYANLVWQMHQLT